MLLSIEVNPVHTAGGGNCASIHEWTVKLGTNLPIFFGHSGAACCAPANFPATAPWATPIGGGAMTNIGGIVIPGSIGALRMVRTSAPMPCAACHAVCEWVAWK